MNKQKVRLFDIWLFGPVLILFGIWFKQLPLYARITLMVLGAGTVLYNLYYYLDVKKLEKDLVDS